MKRVFLAASAALISIVCGSANAQTFAMIFSSTGTAGITDPYPCNRYECDPFISIHWNGNLKVTLDSGADGIYTGSEIELFSLSSNQMDLTFTPDDPNVVGIPSVTVADGRITDFSFDYEQVSDTPSGFQELALQSFSGDSIYGDTTCASGCERPDQWEFFGDATLTPVDEPQTLAFLLGSLCKTPGGPLLPEAA